MQKDFSYPLLVAELPNVENTYTLTPNEAERASITEVLGVENVKSFSSEIKVKCNHKSGKIDVKGWVKAEVELQSVVSLKNFDKKYQTNFEIKYDTNLNLQELDGAEFGLEDEAFDTPIDGKIDLAGIAMEQLSLAIEDYPRQKGETFSFATEFEEEERPNPFAVLSKLKK
ncbi:MAG: hypothetical protein PHE89_06980 [Alphaproteobacteria bacterium]|nr:hypothetical protein [Alphaproteobacteria bacterium]